MQRLKSKSLGSKQIIRPATAAEVCLHRFFKVVRHIEAIAWHIHKSEVMSNAVKIKCLCVALKSQQGDINLLKTENKSWKHHGIGCKNYFNNQSPLKLQSTVISYHGHYQTFMVK